MTTKILYLLHTDWAWIKQRSQFIAEELHGLGMDVTVVYKLSPRRTTLVRNQTPIPVRPLPFLPFQWRTKGLLRGLDDMAWGLVLRMYIRRAGFTHVIVTHPLLGRYVKDLSACLIYDCHDDNAEFYPAGPLKALIETRHAELLERTALNVFSSAHLEDKYRTDTPSIVVRNGHTIDGDVRVIDEAHVQAQEGDGGKDFTLFYFGTVSEWFDFNLILRLLEACENLKVEVIGPADVQTVAHPRVIYTGPMNHAELLVHARQADGFIMPFTVNPLIEGVDPVKLYEYLAYDVPVLSVFYDELRHFEGLVDFYRSTEEAIERVREYIHDQTSSRIDKPARKAFLAASTWRARAAQYAAAITSLAPVSRP